MQNQQRKRYEMSHLSTWIDSDMMLGDCQIFGLIICAGVELSAFRQQYQTAGVLSQSQLRGRPGRGTLKAQSLTSKVILEILKVVNGFHSIQPVQQAKISDVRGGS